MNKIIISAALILWLSVGIVSAQELRSDSSALNYNRELEERNSERGLGIEADDSVEDKASAAAMSMSAQSKDEILESKTGPDGESIYVGEFGYYYFDKSGTRIVIEPDMMKIKK